MSKVKLITISIAGAGLVAVLLGLFLFPEKAEDRTPPEPVAIDQTYAGLGITYLPITRGLSEYYGLGVDHGALVTDVMPGSPADRSGIQVGDVITTFDGAPLRPKAQLLGMMMACPEGHTVILEVWSGTETKIIKIVHQASQE